MPSVSCLLRQRLSTLPLALLVWISLLALEASGQQALHVGTSADYPPFSSRDGDLKGLDVDIASRFARDAGRRLEWKLFRWPNLLSQLQAGDFDVVMSGVTMRPERALIGRYTRPYANTGAVALIRESDASDFSGPETLNHPSRRLAVNAGGHLEGVARRLFPRATLRTVTDNLSLPRLVAGGEVDAAISDSAEARVFAGTNLRVVGPFTSDFKAYLLPATNAELARRLDEWMVERERDGWLREQRRTWLGFGPPADEASAARQAVVAFIRLRLDVMPFVAATKRAEGMPVEDREQEARVLHRVRDQSSNPDRSAAVYRVLIDMAKRIQNESPPAKEKHPLGLIRNAIQRIDEQLLRELDRSGEAGPTDWLVLLDRHLADLPIPPDQRNQLAAALAISIGD